ncbi:hypothetical protein Taro_050476 [Colocasia esculenta]|uniref:Uncharacterized protein n=1 Tax=Colocasia esculenta TaxID=4460 RepID=A0A843XDV5_COLES|nr:hypothetical protein [Colocasia esculenta]
MTTSLPTTAVITAWIADSDGAETVTETAVREPVEVNSGFPWMTAPNGLTKKAIPSSSQSRSGTPSRVPVPLAHLLTRSKASPTTKTPVSTAAITFCSSLPTTRKACGKTFEIFQQSPQRASTLFLRSAASTDPCMTETKRLRRSQPSLLARFSAGNSPASAQLLFPCSRLFALTSVPLTTSAKVLAGRTLLTVSGPSRSLTRQERLVCPLRPHRKHVRTLTPPAEELHRTPPPLVPPPRGTQLAPEGQDIPRASLTRKICLSTNSFICRHIQTCLSTNNFISTTNLRFHPDVRHYWDLFPCSISLLSDVGRYGRTGLERGLTEMVGQIKRTIHKLVKGMHLSEEYGVILMEKSSATRGFPVAKAAYAFLKDNVSPAFGFPSWNKGRLVCQRPQLKRLSATTSEQSPDGPAKDNLVSTTDWPFPQPGTRVYTSESENGRATAEKVTLDKSELMATAAS